MLDQPNDSARHVVLGQSIQKAIAALVNLERPNTGS